MPPPPRRRAATPRGGTAVRKDALMAAVRTDPLRDHRPARRRALPRQRGDGRRGRPRPLPACCSSRPIRSRRRRQSHTTRVRPPSRSSPRGRGVRLPLRGALGAVRHLRSARPGGTPRTAHDHAAAARADGGSRPRRPCGHVDGGDGARHAQPLPRRRRLRDSDRPLVAAGGEPLRLDAANPVRNGRRPLAVLPQPAGHLSPPGSSSAAPTWRSGRRRST